MAHAVERGWRPGRALALIVGLILTTGILVAQTPKKDSKLKPKPKETKKEKPAPPRTKAITLPSDVGNDVREMVGVINSKLEAAWKENNLTPSANANDYEFLRRASLDIIGRIAKPQEIAQFLKDPKDTRRTKLIDRLLASPDYPRHWANVWTNWLLSRSGAFGRGKYHEELATWLEDQFAQNKKYHDIVHDLLTAKGKNTDNGAVNFMLAHVGLPEPAARRRENGQFDMVPLTSRVTRLFLGIQTRCTQCHDHPFDANLKQEHFWGINVFLRQIARDGTPPNMRRRNMGYPPLTLREDAGANPDGIIVFEKRNAVFKETQARFFEKSWKALNLKRDFNRREELARLIMDHDNFSKAIVNRMWGSFFGKGFCNPIDDFNEQNQVANPELLAELGKKFKHYGYDMKRLIRWICNSEAYNLSVVANKTNDKAENEVFFSRMLIKALSPEQLFESLMVATQSDQAKEAKKKQMDDWLGSLVQNFGDDEGNEVSFNGTIIQALMMMNGKDINEAISRDKGTVKWALDKGRYLRPAINELYLAILNRPVGAQEYARLVPKLALRRGFKDSGRAALEDLMWGLLNSNEFMLNH